MPRKVSVPHELWELARSQAGVLSTSQAAAHGLTRSIIQRLLDDRLLWQITRGLYGLSPDPTWEGLAWGGFLLGGCGAVLGLRSAGHLHGINPQPEVVDVLVPRRLRSRGHWRFHRLRATGTGEPPRTPIEATALHLAADASGDSVFSVLSRALGTRRTTAERMLAALTTMPDLPQGDLLCEVLGDIATGVHSALEARYRYEVEQLHGLPPGERQAQVVAGAYSDVAYRPWKVVVELDGLLGHQADGAFRDSRRDNRSVLVGYTPLRFGWADIAHSPCDVAAVVARALKQRGWPDDLAQCPKC